MFKCNKYAVYFNGLTARVVTRASADIAMTQFMLILIMSDHTCVLDSITSNRRQSYVFSIKLPSSVEMGALIFENKCTAHIT